MAQTDNPFLDGMSKLFTDAAGAAKSVRDEVDTFVKHQMERLLADMNLVKRDEFEAVKAMAAKAREQNDALEARLNGMGAVSAVSGHGDLEARLAALEQKIPTAPHLHNESLEARIKALEEKIPPMA